MRAFAAVLLAAVLAPLAALAGPLSQSCLVGDRPAASLLFPYFEVDLADEDGISTLVSISNATAEMAIAHVTLWTDWGLPTITFDIGFEADTVWTFDLRHVLHGEIPPSAAVGTPNCALPIPPIPVDVDQLQARHTGQPDPSSGLCWGSGRLEPTVATGYLTVDAVRDCGHDSIPGDIGYFDDGEGLATNDNVLFGEFYLMDPGEDFAQGIAAVPLVADADLFEPDASDSSGVPDTFYGPWVSHDDSDDRSPLSSRHRARFLYGGGFDGTTDLLVWTAGLGTEAEPKTCGEGPFDDSFELPTLGFDVRNEAGELLHHLGAWVPPAVTLRLPIGGDELPVAPGSFGTVDVEALLVNCPTFSPCTFPPLQSWVGHRIGALGRFSVGLGATRLDDPCRSTEGPRPSSSVGL